MEPLTATRTEERGGYTLLYTDDAHVALTNNGLDWLAVTPDSCSCPLFGARGSCRHIPLAFGDTPGRASAAERPPGAPRRRRTVSQPPAPVATPLLAELAVFTPVLDALARWCFAMARELDPELPPR